jgi:hypothetical protein
MTDTCQNNSEHEVQGFWKMTVGQREEALRNLEAALKQLGMNPAEELARLATQETPNGIIQRVALAFGHKNDDCAVHWNRVVNEVFLSYSYKHDRQRFMSPQDWSERFGLTDIGLEKGHPLNYFPWRRKDLQDNGPGQQLPEYETSFGFFAPKDSLLDHFLDRLDPFVISVDKEKILHLLSISQPWGMYNQRDYWCLMPVQPLTLRITEDMDFEDRERQIPSGYMFADLKDTLIYLISCQVLGHKLDILREFGQVRFLCANHKSPRCHIVTASYDGKGSGMYIDLDKNSRNIPLIQSIKKRYPSYYNGPYKPEP